MAIAMAIELASRLIGENSLCAKSTATAQSLGLKPASMSFAVDFERAAAFIGGQKYAIRKRF